MRKYKLSYGEAATKVEITAYRLGNDIQAIITACKAHIGATALAIPCPGNPEGVQASCSVLTAPGHRDNIPAEAAALKLCKAFGCNVCVTAGLHIDKASKEEILTLVANSSQAVDLLINIMKEG